MKPTVPDLLEKYRLQTGPYGSNHLAGFNGLFRALPGPQKVKLNLMISNGANWEHASVSVSQINKYRRVPTWEEMCWVKDLIWQPEEVVMQLHPRQSEYVNCHPYVLHLWRPTNAQIPTPPTCLIGPVTGK